MNKFLCIGIIFVLIGKGKENKTKNSSEKKYGYNWIQKIKYCEIIYNIYNNNNNEN